jgi:hypothetical protein
LAALIFGAFGYAVSRIRGGAASIFTVEEVDYYGEGQQWL